VRIAISFQILIIIIIIIFIITIIFALLFYFYTYITIFIRILRKIYFIDRPNDVHSPENPLRDAALNSETIEEFWELLFNEEIINIIVEHTNEKIEEVCAPLCVENKIEIIIIPM